MSTPSPITRPCTATITGNGHRSGAPMACWNSSNTFRMARDALAASWEESAAASASPAATATAQSHQLDLLWNVDMSALSSPAVKSFGILDDMTTTRISEGCSANVSNSFPYSRQYLGKCTDMSAIMTKHSVAYSEEKAFTGVLSRGGVQLFYELPNHGVTLSYRDNSTCQT